MTSSPTDEITDFIDSYIAEHYANVKYEESVTLKPLSGGTHDLFKVSVSIGDTIHNWVVKLTTAEEIQVLQMFAARGVNCVPGLLAHRITPTHNLVLLPEYSGCHGDFGDDLPESILKVLALIHASFMNVDCDLPATDDSYFESLFRSSFGDPTIYPEYLRDKVIEIRSSVSTFASPARDFPHTLVHWDVHPGNILVNAAESVLLDWGNARVGPAMVDLANVVRWDSSDFRTYVTAFESQTHQPFDFELAKHQYNWARALTEVKYLPYGADHMSQEIVESKVNDVLAWVATQA